MWRVSMGNTHVNARVTSKYMSMSLDSCVPPVDDECNAYLCIPEGGLIHVYQIIKLEIPQLEILYNFLKMSEQIMYGSQKLVIV